MMKKALSIALGIMLLAAGSAGASRTDDSDVQAPRGSHVQALRSHGAEDVQASRERPEDIQAPRGDEDVQAPRGAYTRD